MPFIHLTTTFILTEDKRKDLLAALSKLVADVTGKPEQYVMVAFSSGSFLMSGKPGEAAFVDLRAVGGLTDEVNRQLSQRLCALLQEFLGIPPARVYLNFTDVPATHWGWRGETFG